MPAVQPRLATMLHTCAFKEQTLKSLESGLYAVFAESTENTSLWQDWVSMFVWPSANQPPTGKVT